MKFSIKINKKIILMTFLFSVLTTIGVTKEEIIQTIVSVHTRTFGKDDLFKKQLEAEDAEAWNKLLAEVEKFIHVRPKGSEPLNEFGNKVLTLARELINANKTIYSTVFGSREVTASNVEAAQQILEGLENQKKKLIALSNELKKKEFKDSAQKEAQEVLLNLFLVVELTIPKLAKDFGLKIAPLLKHIIPKPKPIPPKTSKSTGLVNALEALKKRLEELKRVLATK